MNTASIESPSTQSPPLKRQLLLLSAALLAVILLAIWLPATAAPVVELAVVDRDNGQLLQQYPSRGHAWIAGIPGHRYAVRMTNTSNQRVLVVLSVDGVNAVSGEDADPSQAGYVLAPWQSTEITGWRKSMQDVAQFVFTDLPDSYAARTGRPDNVGVIGIAVFGERQVAPPHYPAYAPPYNAARRSADKAGAPAMESRAGGMRAEGMEEGVARQRIGTGHGGREWSPVNRTEFVRASRSPAQVTQLRYDDVGALVALGIIPQPYLHRWPDGPDAFPGGFVADPPR